MVSFLSQLEVLALRLLEQSLAGRVLVTVAILALGFGVSRGAARLIRYLRQGGDQDDMVERIRGRSDPFGAAVGYLIMIGSLVVALLYMNASATSRMLQQVAQYVPNIVTAILLFLLGVLVTKGIIRSIAWGMEYLRLKEAATIGVSGKIAEAFLTTLKLFLYLVVFEIALIQLGVSPEIINTTLTAASYGVVVLVVLLAFYGFKGLVQNYAAGIYLRNTNVLEPGKRVKLDGESGEVRDVTAFSTTVSTDSGYFLLAPNKELMDSSVLFKRVTAEVETLDDIKDYFVTENSRYPGAAACEMGLTIFGFDITQGDIGEELSETDVAPEELGAVVTELTNEEVRTAFVPSDKITDLAAEFRVWFNNEALLLPYFNTAELFPETEGEHYVLGVGVEGDELLVVDPTSGESGGVYYVDADELMRAMDGIEDGGYLVLAPRGTTAFWRIKKGLIYSHLSLYQQLSKSLELQLSKILRRGEVVKQIVPDAVEDFIERWTEGEHGRVRQMWQPETGGDTKLDEFTDRGG